MTELKDSDCILQDCICWIRANTNNFKQPLPKTLHDHFDRWLDCYNQSISAEGGGQLSSQRIIEEIKAMALGVCENTEEELSDDKN